MRKVAMVTDFYSTSQVFSPFLSTFVYFILKTEQLLPTRNCPLPKSFLDLLANFKLLFLWLFKGMSNVLEEVESLNKGFGKATILNCA